MIKYLYLILLLGFTPALAQKNYEPQLLILSPNNIKYTAEFKTELNKLNNDISSKLKSQNNLLESEEFRSQPLNIQLMTKSEIGFIKKLDFFKQTSYITEQYLVYRFYERFPNVLIKLKDTISNGALAELQKFANEENLQYILNFSSIELYKKSGISYAKITAQLYDRSTNSIMSDKAFIGDWNNPGFEFSCEDRSINCTINNALAQITAEVIRVIATNSPSIKRDQQLARERAEVLHGIYLKKDFDPSLLSKLINPLDSNVNLSRGYKSLFSPDSTKFVAFFMTEAGAQDFKSLAGNNKDHNVKILSSKNIKDKGLLDDIPQNYGYAVKGVEFDGKWYYEKFNVTYFEAKTLAVAQEYYLNNLSSWSFFKEDDTTFDHNFWEAEQFQKIKNLKEDKDWAKYGKSIWMNDEANNRDYIGLYEVVANSLKAERAKDNLTFENTISSLKFKPFYEKFKKEKRNGFFKYQEHSLIFPKERDVVINPVLLTDSKGIEKVHYFVLIGNGNELYEWTFFEPKTVTKELDFGSAVVDQFNTIIDWNFSYDNLNNRNFWSQKVLFKEGSSYKYLQKVN